MFGSVSGSKPSLGLSISTSAANTPNTSGQTSNQSGGSSLFGGSTFTPASNLQPPNGSLGGTTSQPGQSGGLFGFGSSLGSTTFSSAGTTPSIAATSQPASSGLFGATTSQSAPGGLFGSLSTQPTLGAGLTGLAKSQSATNSGMFGLASQPAPQGGLFGATSQPSQGLFNNPSNAPQSNNFFGGLNQSTAAEPAATLSLGQQSTLLGASSSNARIDLEHLRPTTKFDQLTEELQREILNLDTHILNEINRCNEVSNLLPTIVASGSNIPNDVSYVAQKLEEVETGLENDASEIQDLKESTVQKDTNEARVCFRELDRLKMPSQYQASVTGASASISAGVYGGHGLPGWWNHPQTLQRSIRGGTGAGGSRALQLPGDEDEAALASGSASVVDFFDQRAEEMRNALMQNKALLTQIEEFVVGVEGKIALRQRELLGRDGGPSGFQEGEDQVLLLQYVFEEFERGLYEVANKVGGVRDGVRELVLGS